MNGCTRGSGILPLTRDVKEVLGEGLSSLPFICCISYVGESNMLKCKNLVLQKIRPQIIPDTDGQESGTLIGNPWWRKPWDYG